LPHATHLMQTFCTVRIKKNDADIWTFFCGTAWVANRRLFPQIKRLLPRIGRFLPKKWKASSEECWARTHIGFQNAVQLWLWSFWSCICVFQSSHGLLLHKLRIAFQAHNLANVSKVNRNYIEVYIPLFQCTHPKLVVECQTPFCMRDSRVVISPYTGNWATTGRWTLISNTMVY